MTTLQILPLQLNLRSDLGVDILCDDALAHLDPQSGILHVTVPRSPRGRFGKDCVRFVVRDPAPTGGVHCHATMLSGPSFEQLVQWHREGNVSRSPYIAAGNTVEVWATVLAQAPGDPGGAKLYKARRYVKVDFPGGGDLSIL